MSLSLCTAGEFNYEDENWVEMEQRCNQRMECPDGSDEFNYLTVPVIKQYQVSLFQRFFFILTGKILRLKNPLLKLMILMVISVLKQLTSESTAFWTFQRQ